MTAHDPCSPHHNHHVFPVPMGRPQQLVTVTKRNLDTDILGRSTQVPVIVLLGSPLTPGYTRLEETLRALASQAQFRWILALINADTDGDVVAKFRPPALPAVYAVVGAASTAIFEDGDLGEWINSIVASVRLDGIEVPETEELETDPLGQGNKSMTSDSRVQEAVDAVNNGDFCAAAEIYDELLQLEPSDMLLQRARAAVSVLLRVEESDRSIDPIEAAAANPGDVGLALQAADVLVLFDRPEEAVSLLSACVNAETASGLRPRLLELCLFLDPAHEAVTDARRRLAMFVFA